MFIDTSTSVRVSIAHLELDVEKGNFAGIIESTYGVSTEDKRTKSFEPMIWQ